VYYVDTTGWLASSDFTDGTHPTDAGHQKIADHLAPIIAAKL
jgi:lysophospholipase L1-like esterase